MRVRLMHRERDFDPEQRAPYNERDLTQDLELDSLIHAMAGDDKFLDGVARTAILSGPQNDLETIVYRQGIVKDALENSGAIRELYALAVEALERRRRHWFGISSRHPDTILSSAIDPMKTFVDMFRKMRTFVGEQAGRFESEGFTALFATVEKELTDEYLDGIEAQLEELRFDRGVLVSAELGDGNAGTNYVLRKPRGKEPNWLERLFLVNEPRSYTFTIADRDEAGFAALAHLRNRGLNLVANALAQSVDHVESFFQALRTETAFYVACVNLHEQLTTRGQPACIPVAVPEGERVHSFAGLYDVSLVLNAASEVVGNDVNADGRSAVIITGANQGGKSTFLRSVGQAQLMMQCGLFVGAESFRAGISPAVFTHYKREEDATMKSGKFDEELARMSEIADHLVTNSLLLFNESFAATNEREGSEIARQILRALLENGMKVFFVTHLFEFAHRLEDQGVDVMFLRAERNADGTRTFRLIEGAPLETSFGEDVYRQVFEIEREQ